MEKMSGVAEDRKARWSERRSRGEKYKQGGEREQTDRKRAERFREEVSYFRTEDVISAPEKNAGILTVTPPCAEKDIEDKGRMTC